MFSAIHCKWSVWHWSYAATEKCTTDIFAVLFDSNEFQLRTCWHKTTFHQHVFVALAVFFILHALSTWHSGVRVFCHCIVVLHWRRGRWHSWFTGKYKKFINDKHTPTGISKKWWFLYVVLYCCSCFAIYAQLVCVSPDIFCIFESWEYVEKMGKLWPSKKRKFPNEMYKTISKHLNAI